MLVTRTSFQNRPLPGCDCAARSWAASIFCRRRRSAISPAGRGGFGGGPWAVMGSAVAGVGAVEWRHWYWKAGRRARAGGERRAARRGTRRRDIVVLVLRCCRCPGRAGGQAGGGTWRELRVPRRRSGDCHGPSLGSTPTDLRVLINPKSPNPLNNAYLFRIPCHSS